MKSSGSGFVYKNWAVWAGHALVGVMILLALAGLLNHRQWHSYAVDLYSGTNGYMERDWTLEQDGVTLAVFENQPGFYELQQGQTYTLSTTLTYDGGRDSSPYVFFYTRHVYCRILLDGREIFRYQPQDLVKRDHSKSPGNIYSSVPLPDDCRGKKFVMEFTPVLDSLSEYQLPNAYFGDYPTMMHSIFVDDIPNNVISLMAGFLGLIAILFSTIAFRGKAYREGIFVGLFAVLFSIYTMTESLFNLHLVSNPYYTYLVNLSSFAAMPVALAAFYREKFTGMVRKIGGGVLAVGITDWFLQFFLHFTGLQDLRESLPMTYGFYTLVLASLIMMLLFMDKSPKRKLMVIQLVPVALGLLADTLVHYLHLRISTTNSEFTSFGIIIFMLLEVSHVWKSSIHIYTESVRSRYYQEIAFVDPLTGIGNRRAFDQEKLALKTGQRKCCQVLVASVDVNDLKVVNDTKGHMAGDYLIRSTARVLQEMTREKGLAFRTGGDEFMVLLYDVDDAEFSDIRRRTSEIIKGLNRTGTVHLSMAMGYEITEPGNIEAAMLLADQKMYENKRAEKAACCTN